MSSHVALWAIGSAQATARQSFESMAERFHRSTSQHSPPVQRRPMHHVKLLERNLKDLSLEELVAVADRVKTPTVTTLRLVVTPQDPHEVNDRFTLLDKKTTQACLHFARSLAVAIGGWLQQLELGLRLWNRELKLLAEAFCSTKTLRRLSFANSELGDTRFQILAKSLRECVPLNTLNLSGCELTDLSVPYIVSIVKGSPNVERAKPEEEHTPGQLSPEQALACQVKLQKAQKSSQEWSSRQFPLQGKWAPASSTENSATSQKDVDWQASLRQSGTMHSACFPSKEAVEGVPGLRSLDLSHNQFTDDLADELCPVLCRDAPLSDLNLQSNKLTREGAKTFEAVMKDRRVLQIVDLRDNKQEVATHVARSANVEAAAAKSIPCPIYPKESSRTQTNDPISKYRRSFLAKPKHASKVHITGSTVQKNKPTKKLADNGCISPAVQVAINKLPLRPKSAPESGLNKPLQVVTPRFYRPVNPLNGLTSRRVDSEFEFISRSTLNTHRHLRDKLPSRDHKRQETGRPKSAPERIRIPLGLLKKTSRGKAYFKNPRFTGSVPGSARKQSNRSQTEDIAPWEGGKTAKESRHPHATLPSKINAEPMKGDTAAPKDKTPLPPGRTLKKRKTRSKIFQIPNSRQATRRTVTSRVPLLSNKNIQTVPEKQKRKPKVKPNVVKRREALFQNGKEGTAAKAQEIPSTSEAEEVPKPTPLVSVQQKKPLSPPIETVTGDSHEWNNFMSEMTKTLLNLNGTRLPHLAEVVQA